MNRTQKVAWFTLGMSILTIAFFTHVLRGMLSTTYPSKLLVLVWPLMIFGFIGIFAVFPRKKQSPEEVDFDERDNIIKKRAVTAAFVSVWIFLILATIIPIIVTENSSSGDFGYIPVTLLPIINWFVFLSTFLVYSVAILIQYNKGGKENE